MIIKVGAIGDALGRPVEFLRFKIH
jgi:ADP-ribosylglycohydrolase